MSNGKYLFTSESVSMGHPDKLADQISDAILDSLLAVDSYSRVACETMVTTGLAVLAGEITTQAKVDYREVARHAITAAGYTDDRMGICGDTCGVLLSLGTQSPDIAMGVNENTSAGKDIGAGDQGLMFGFACNDTPELMPLPIALAHRVINRLTVARQKSEVNWLRPDAKSQVTVEYDGDKPVRIDTVVVSTQHCPEVSQKEIRDYVIGQIIEQRAQIGRCKLFAPQPGLGAADEQCRRQHCQQMVGLGGRAVERGKCCRILGLARRLFDHAAQPRDRRTEIMRQAIGHQPQLRHQGLDAVEHRIDRAAQRVERVAAAIHRHPAGQRARLHRPCGRHHPADLA